MERALHRSLSETVRVIPLAQNDAIGGRPDTSRAEYIGAGILRLKEPYSAEIVKSDLRVRYSESSVDIEKAALPVDWDFRKDDAVIAIDRDGAPQFYVTRVETDWHAFIRLTLGPMGAP